MSAGVKVTSPIYSDRMQHLCFGVDKTIHKGLEIGALNWPVFRPEDVDVKFVDFTSTEELRRNSYASDPSRIVDVDYIWTGSGSLADVIGSEEMFDFAIASHVIEHIPNTLGWLRGIRAVLKPGGRLNLAIPDRRFTFDAARKETTIAELVEADLLDLRIPNIRQVFDHTYMVRQIDPGGIWRSGQAIDSYPKMSGADALREALNKAISAQKAGAYHDVHCTVFTPASFLSVMEDAARLNLFSFYLDEFVTTGPGGEGPRGFEFFASLVRPASKSTSQDELIDRIASIRKELSVMERHNRLLSGA